MKRNRLAAKRAEDLVFIHTNLSLVSRKDSKYKRGAEKLWDVAPESADSDLTIQDLARATMLDVDEDDNIALGASSASGTGLGDNEDLLAVAENPIDNDFFDNPFDD